MQRASALEKVITIIVVFIVCDGKSYKRGKKKEKEEKKRTKTREMRY